MKAKLNSLTKAELIKEGQSRSPKVELNMKMLKSEMIAKLDSAEVKPATAATGRRGEH